MAKMWNRKLGLVLGLGLAAASLGACGGGGPSGAGGYRDLGSLKSALDAPTGTVDSASAKGVASAFEESSSAGLGGFRQKQQAESASIPCSGGGSIEASGDQNRVDFSYSSCVESGCTFSGGGSVFPPSDAAGESCFSYDVNAVCEVEGSLALSFSGCISADGATMTYLIEYEGMTYRVSGSYSNGSGELTITGENGTYVCTYSGDTGSCTDGAGGTFDL